MPLYLPVLPGIKMIILCTSIAIGTGVFAQNSKPSMQHTFHFLVETYYLETGGQFALHSLCDCLKKGREDKKLYVYAL